MRRKALTLLLAFAIGYTSADALAAQLAVRLDYTVEGHVPRAICRVMDDYMDRIPPGAARLLATGGWTIVLTTADIATCFGYAYDTIAGVTVESTRTIFISASEVRIRRALLHEVGHALGAMLGDPDAQSAFQSVYEAERATFDQQEKVDEHCVSSAHEYFAEAYRHYVLYPDILRRSAPETYAYLDALFA